MEVELGGEHLAEKVVLVVFGGFAFVMDDERVWGFVGGGVRVRDETIIAFFSLHWVSVNL